MTWVWCPNVDPDSLFLDLATLYPGDDYVDWTGLDGYNWGTNPAKPDRWRSFDELYSSTYDNRRHDRPLQAADDQRGRLDRARRLEGAWIEDALARIPTDYPKIRGLLWFDKYDDGMDWPIETSASAGSAFADGDPEPRLRQRRRAGRGRRPIEPPQSPLAPSQADRTGRADRQRPLADAVRPCLDSARSAADGHENAHPPKHIHARPDALALASPCSRSSRPRLRQGHHHKARDRRRRPKPRSATSARSTGAPGSATS